MLGMEFVAASGGSDPTSDGAEAEAPGGSRAGSHADGAEGPGCCVIRQDRRHVAAKTDGQPRSRDMHPGFGVRVCTAGWCGCVYFTSRRAAGCGLGNFASVGRVVSVSVQRRLGSR